MLAAYTFNTEYRPNPQGNMPQLRLLEGGKFMSGDYAPILLQEEGKIRLKYFQWGLITDLLQVRPDREARLYLTAEQSLRRPPYLSLLRRQRCLIPTDGFYVNGKQGQAGSTLKVAKASGDTFCLAGVYDIHQQEDGQLLHSFAVLTVNSPMRLSLAGRRMPLILPSNVEATWLNPYTDLNKIQKMLQLPLGTGLSVHHVQELRLPAATQFDPLAA